MAAAFVVFNVVIPEENGWTNSLERLPEHIKDTLQERYLTAEVTQEPDGPLTIITPYATSPLVKSIVEHHYGFELKDKPELHY